MDSRRNPNFRQVGQDSPQNLQNTHSIKKSIPGCPRVAPSIPSKYVVREKRSKALPSKAFGSAVNRFSVTENALPGPGYYYRSKYTVGTSKNGHSKLGFGVGFVSKMERFKSSKATERDSPGPGHYSVDDLTAWTGRVLPSGRYDRGSNWGKGLRFNSTSNNINDSPGPGYYDLNRALKKTIPFGGRKGSSSFTSASKRDSVYRALLRQSGPAPGTYNIDKQPWLSGSGGYAFKSKTKRNKTVAPNNPGPCSYDNIVNKKTDMNFSTKGTSAFANTLTDRWGVLYVRKSKNISEGTPGPGAYSPALINSVEKQRATSSWAASSTLRDGAVMRGRRPPGPCYYKPEMPKRQKSFHLNVNKRWL
eukprot:GSMAST32.ASY1.ANO1.121.1 assembled CDS